MHYHEQPPEKSEVRKKTLKMAKDLNVFDREYGLLIDGAWTQPGTLLESHNPASGTLLAKFTDATDADVDAAVAAARRAFETWRKTTAA